MCCGGRKLYPGAVSILTHTLPSPQNAGGSVAVPATWSRPHEGCRPAQLPLFPAYYAGRPARLADALCTAADECSPAPCVASAARSTLVYLSSRIATESKPPVSTVDPCTYRTVARITRKGALVYTVRVGGGGNLAALAAGRAKLIGTGFSGAWSAKSKSKVRRIAEAWLYGRTAQRGDVWSTLAADSASRAFVLLTLTLSAAQAHTDQEIRRLLLGPFLQDLKRKHQAANYMWFAEKQGNGNIHFHIILDRFVPHESARRLWNKAQDRCGYVARYRAGREAWHAGGFHYDQADARSKAQQQHAYQEGVRVGWSNPSSTDIRQVRGADAVIAYVVEYCAKGVQGEAGSVQNKLEGHLWGCNRELGKLSRYEIEVTPELDTVFRAAVEAERMQKIEGERWTYYAGDIGRELAYELPGLYSDFRSHWRAQALLLPSRRAARRAARALMFRTSTKRRKEATYS